MSASTSPSAGVPRASIAETEPAHPISGLIDATETLYPLTVDEYERIAGFLDDDRVELIDGYLVKKMTKNPHHVVGCARVLAAFARIAPPGWHGRPGEPVRIGPRTEPEPDVSLARGTVDDYAGRHPGPADVAVVVEVAGSSQTTISQLDTSAPRFRRRSLAGSANSEPFGLPNCQAGEGRILPIWDDPEVADTTPAKDRRRQRTYGPAGIPVYWIINLPDRKVEVYTSPGPDGYAARTDYSPGMSVPLEIDGVIVGEIAVDDLLPS
jgi:Uma2 family endonuclease